ncbi:hypothetical protein [Weissella minor]|uniref:hypothetical protein n=1 Tax=Weissella minor TaxID=1620 RepID=UPI003AF1E335
MMAPYFLSGIFYAGIIILLFFLYEIYLDWKDNNPVSVKAWSLLFIGLIFIGISFIK